MKDRVIVVTNLGEFKAYRIHQDRNSSARLEPIPAEDTPNEHGKRSNTLTVMEGKSASTPSNQGTTATGSDGEQHNMELEKRRRAVKKIVDNVGKILNGEPERTCAIAAPKEILGQILETMHPTVRVRIDQSLPLDLTWAPKADLLNQFCQKPAPNR
jgi:hypothetical protein